MPFCRAVLKSSSSIQQFSSLELIIFPREMTETLRPELPKLRQSILPALKTDISEIFIFSDPNSRQIMIKYNLLTIQKKDYILMDNQQYQLPQRFWCYKKSYDQLAHSKVLFQMLFIDYKLCIKCIFRIYGLEHPKMYSDHSFYIEILPSLLDIQPQDELFKSYRVGQCCLTDICWSCESIFQRPYLRQIVEEVKKQIDQKGFSQWQKFKLNIRVPNMIILKNLMLARYIYFETQKKDTDLAKLFYRILILPIETNKVLDHKTVLKWTLANELNQLTNMTSTSDDNDNNLVISLQMQERSNSSETSLMKMFSSHLGLEKKKEKAKGRKNCIDLGQEKEVAVHAQQYKCNSYNLNKIIGLRQPQFDSIFNRVNSREQFWRLIGRENKGILHFSNIIYKVSLITRNVYLCGKYIKFSRYLSQTPWIVNGKKLSQGSLQQEIEDRIFQLFYPNKKKEQIQIKFHSGGRQDIDVRMLKGGRPFVLEFVNPIKSINTIKQQDVFSIAPEYARQHLRQEFEKWLKQNQQGNNQENHSWRIVKLLQILINFENQYVQVLELQQTTESYISVQLKAAETEKIKHYLCYIYSMQPLIQEDQVTLGGVKDMSLQQLTPLRVLHRRTLLNRDKIIHRLKLHLVSKHSGILQVWASAGTYIKQFVHGDLGRTSPNIGSILKKEIDILQLDVGSLKQGQWKSGDEQLMKMQRFQWMD